MHTSITTLYYLYIITSISIAYCESVNLIGCCRFLSADRKQLRNRAHRASRLNLTILFTRYALIIGFPEGGGVTPS